MIRSLDCKNRLPLMGLCSDNLYCRGVFAYEDGWGRHYDFQYQRWQPMSVGACRCGRCGDAKHYRPIDR